MSSDRDENQAIGQRMQEKFFFYLVALTFTILGLSIQTAHFGEYIFINVLELASWILFTISGLIGLWHLENIPELYRIFSMHDKHSRMVKDTRKGIESGVKELFVLEDGATVSMSDHLQGAIDAVRKIDDYLKPYQKKVALGYKCQRVFFVCAIFCLVAARALPPIMDMVFVN